MVRRAQGENKATEGEQDQQVKTVKRVLRDPKVLQVKVLT